MPNETLRGLWERELQDLYATEKRIVGALPDLIGTATSSELKAALEKHLRRTNIHVERLDLIFKQCGLSAASTVTAGIDGIVQSGTEQVRTAADADVRDAAIIAAAQHVEHYEMAGYGCARTWAQQLGDEQAADLLQQTLDEEGAADKELTDIAQSGINQNASGGAEYEAPPRRLRYVSVKDLPGAADRYRNSKIRNRAGEEMGRVDGFIVDAGGRPYYLVIDSGGLFVGRNYVVPIGRADLKAGDGAFTVDLDKDTLKRYPEFRRDAFVAMTDEEARRYEWRVLEAIDPTAARSSTRGWDYDRYPYYRKPDWFDPAWGAYERSSSAASSRRFDVPIAERTDRERVVASENRPDAEGRPSDREQIRGGRSDEDLK